MTTDQTARPVFVKQLRSGADYIDPHGYTEIAAMLREAADLLTAQQAALEELRQQCEFYNETAAVFQTERDGARAALEIVRRERDEARARAAKNCGPRAEAAEAALETLRRERDEARALLQGEAHVPKASTT